MITIFIAMLSLTKESLTNPEFVLPMQDNVKHQFFRRRFENVANGMDFLGGDLKM